MTTRANRPAEAALAGRRVIEFADETGAYCGKLLADMGADVIKVERPGGDPARLYPPFWGGEPDPDRSLSFLLTNTNKRSVELDMESEAGRAQFAQLAVGSDLVIETCIPGTLDAWGVGYDALSASNPALVLTSITGFGQTGPHRTFRSSDIVASALGGAMVVTGEEEDPPVKLAGSQVIVCASTNAAASSMIALHHATRSGRGQHVDISLEETFAAVTNITGVGKWLEDDRPVPTRFGMTPSSSHFPTPVMFVTAANVSSSEMSTCCPRPVRVAWCSAIMLLAAAFADAHRMACEPASLTGGSPASPVTPLAPPSALATMSDEWNPRWGPVWPKPVMEVSTSAGFDAASAA